MSIIGEGITHRGLVPDEFNIGWNIAAGVVAADVGKAMSIDTTAPRTAKLAADGEVIIGTLSTLEIRAIEGLRVGTLSMKGGLGFTRAAGAPAVTPGSILCGAGGGLVRMALVGDGSAIKIHRTVATAATGVDVEAFIL